MFTGLGLVIALCAAVLLGRTLTSATQAGTGPEIGEDAKAEEAEEEAEAETDEDAGALVGRTLTEDFGTASRRLTQPSSASLWRPPG